MRHEHRHREEVPCAACLAPLRPCWVHCWSTFFCVGWGGVFAACSFVPVVACVPVRARVCPRVSVRVPPSPALDDFSSVKCTHAERVSSVQRTHGRPHTARVASGCRARPLGRRPSTGAASCHALLFAPERVKDAVQVAARRSHGEPLRVVDVERASARAGAAASHRETGGSVIHIRYP